MSYREYTEEWKCDCGNSMLVMMACDNGQAQAIEQPVVCDVCEEEVEG